MNEIAKLESSYEKKVKLEVLRQKIPDNSGLFLFLSFRSLVEPFKNSLSGF